MLEPATILKVVHALLGVWFVGALIGRWVTLGAAARATEIGALRGMLTVSSRFESLVRTVPIAVFALGIATAIAQGRPFLGPIQGAPVDWLFASLIVFLSPLPLVPLVFLPRGRVFEAALDEATAQGVVTDRLRTAFRDPVVFAAHAYELGAMVVVLTLMIAKPF
jgi:ribose/xylose/arabinose/galactoside ABC-type transport system permease subunit